MDTKGEQVKVYEFDDFSLFAENRTLYRLGGDRVSLTPRVFDTLLYLVANAGRLIEKDELMEAVWPDTVVEENNLNKNISVLRRVLGEKQGENRYIATVPGRGYKFVAQVSVSTAGKEGAAATDSSFGRLSPSERNSPSAASGRKDDAERPVAENAGPAPSRKWITLAVAGIVLMAGAAVVVYFSDSRRGTSRTLAVLPFKPLVAEKRDEVLEVGMADTLIARLSSDRSLVVRPLASVRRFGGLEQDPVIAGRELGVASVLDGSLQRVGDDIRVNVRLISTTDGASMFSETFDEKFTDIFSLQDRIARNVAAALRSHLEGGSAETRSTDNVDAYRLYLQGRYYFLKTKPPDIRQGIEFYKRAIEIDPDYALAYAGIAQAYATLPITSDVPPSDAFPQARAAAVKALELEPDLTEARIVLGTIEFWYEWRWRDAENELNRAIASDPNNSDAHRFYAVFLTATGRSEEALREIETALAIDPLSLILNALKAQSYFFAGRDSEAIDQANKTLEIEPDFWIAHLMLARVYARRNEFDQAVQAAEKAATFSGGNSEAVALAAYALAKSGKREEAAAILKTLTEESNTRYVSSYNLAIIHHGLGDRDQALQQLESAHRDRDARMIILKVDPKWDDLRSDPRFVDLMEKTGFNEGPGSDRP